MSKAISTLIAAVAALTVSGGAYAQAGGGSTDNSTANQMKGATSGYGMPANANTDSGMAAGSQNAGMSNTMMSTPSLPPLPNNNSLATPSVKSPAAQ
ncbi:hypothetical protein [Paraburkholderia dinghuensis]|uniref:Proteophosphoglycan ppg4 n=1 Tax=Paraburkholderia dinghuensis TaxID=2305225 RepID=A0A3N6N8G8_9BURK|nr:hypothetical protein [Paraburkholderia dinghuensis]RQH04387.1 hypothetical protein D1Y85_18155 [Paraburkholderia dinghuensis]